jgi:hypothetical protein
MSLALMERGVLRCDNASEASEQDQFRSRLDQIIDTPPRMVEAFVAQKILIALGSSDRSEIGFFTEETTCA